MGERELLISITGKSPRCKHPGIEVTVRVPQDVALATGLVIGQHNCIGPRGREFGMRISDAAHAALDEWEGGDDGDRV